MERLRRFIWYLAGRLFLLLTLLSLFTVTFYYAMNATNIYIVLKDGMAKRAQVIMMEEDASELTKFFQSSYLQRDQNLQIALEEIVVNNIMENTDAPQVLVRVDYSEKLDLLTLSIRYQGDHHDPKDSDNELFLEMLEEPTTELIDQIIEPAFGIYNNLIQINFRWEDAQ